MDEVSIDLSQWDEDKLAILNEGVGDLEFLGMNFNIIEEENIQIDRSGSPSKGLCATELEFDGLQCSEEVKGLQDCLDFYDPVHKPVLGSITNGLGFKQGRFC
jgi:hypothetical protein